MSDVSVIIPTYEAGQPLIGAIQSIIEQQGITKQVVVIEDGSALPSLKILEDHFSDYLEPNDFDNDASITYVERKNVGAYHARLSGIEHCDGKYIKFLDQDDVLMAGALAREVNAFESDVDVVLSDWIIGEAIGSDTSPVLKAKKVHAPVLKTPIDDFLTVGGVFTSAALYKAASVRKSLTPVTSFTPVKADDWLIFAQVCLGGARYKTIDNIAYQWNQSHQQLSKLSRSKLVSEHYNILDWIESQLYEKDQLTPERKKLLANYYAKQLLEANALKDGSLAKLVKKINSLDRQYRQQHGNKLYRTFCDLFGLMVGVRLYSFVKKIVFWR